MARFIVISGIDGCGKTTLIRRLRDRLEEEGLATRYEWLRYNHRLVRPVHGLTRLVGLSRRYMVEGTCVWRHEFHRSPLFSSFYVVLTWLDVWLGRLLLAARLMLRNVDVIVCDRWVPDILVDLAVDTRRRSLLGGKWRARFMRILPADTRQYLIVRDSGRIVALRPDVTRDMSYSFRRRLYGRLQRDPDVVVVRNDETIDAAVDAIVRDWKHAAAGISGCQGLRPARSRI
jgi:hypothetical protein